MSEKEMEMRPAIGGRRVQSLARLLRFMLPEHGFVLLITPDSGNSVEGVDIGSNMKREAMVLMLRQVADQAEAMEKNKVGPLQ